MELEVNMVGGGFVRLLVEIDGLDEVADLLRRERALIGQSRPDDFMDGATGDCSGRVLIPAYRIQMIKEV